VLKRVCLVTVALGLVVLAATSAHASCVGPVPFPRAIEAAPAVFVGTVTAVENNRRWATVQVGEVWKGTAYDVRGQC